MDVFVRKQISNELFVSMDKSVGDNANRYLNRTERITTAKTKYPASDGLSGLLEQCLRSLNFLVNRKTTIRKRHDVLLRELMSQSLVK